MGKKYKVEYDRDSCIGALACVAVDEERWEVGDDGKANLINGIEKDGKFYIEIDEQDLEGLKEAAEACPVNVIHIYDEEGNKII